MSPFRPAPLPQVVTPCEKRGYHGPFVNLEKYAPFPEWQGMGDCAVCGTTRDVANQDALRRSLETSAAATR